MIPRLRAPLSNSLARGLANKSHQLFSEIGTLKDILQQNTGKRLSVSYEKRALPSLRLLTVHVQSPNRETHIIYMFKFVSYDYSFVTNLK